MVDPNRKINRLTDRDLEFLEECERDFGLRYTEMDSEFMEHCAKPLDDPPIIDNWTSGGVSDAGYNAGGSRHQNRGGPRHQRNWRGHGFGDSGSCNNRNFRQRRGDRGAGRDLYGDNNGSDSRYQAYKRPSFNQQNRVSSSRPPMTITRDYNNFVAASKDD